MGAINESTIFIQFRWRQKRSAIGGNVIDDRKQQVQRGEKCDAALYLHNLLGTCFSFLSLCFSMFLSLSLRLSLSLALRQLVKQHSAGGFTDQAKQIITLLKHWNHKETPPSPGYQLFHHSEYESSQLQEISQKQEGRSTTLSPLTISYYLLTTTYSNSP